MNGKGIFSWGNKCKYNGNYKKNIRGGNGVYSFGCNLYDGEWINGLPHGEGTLLNEGLRIVGIFRYGKIFEIIEGKGANRELTEKLTIDSRRVKIKFEDTFKDTFKYTIESKNKSESKIKESRKDIVSKGSYNKKETNSKNSGNKKNITHKNSKDKKHRDKDKGKNKKAKNNDKKNEKEKKMKSK